MRFLGKRKPSQFLRHLKGLAPDVPDDFLRTIWASRLPPHVQAILAGQTEGILHSASHLADKICEVTPQPTAASISPATPDNTSVLLERIEELSRQVASLRTSHNHSRTQSRGRHRTLPRDRRSTSDSSPAPYDICWYHRTFGDESRRCTPPCSHQQRNSHQQPHPHQQETSASRR
jgi:hypothetical protein